MRIIKEGVLPNIEYVFECKTCGCEFAVTGQELFTENPYINKNSYKCPTCSTQVYGYKKQEVESSTSNTGSTTADETESSNEVSE